MKTVAFLFLLTCLSGIHSQAGIPTEPDPLRVRITDTRHEPIFGVYVIHKTHSFLLTSTDIDGECFLHTEALSLSDSIQFQGMGYEVITQCLKDLKNNSQIVLKELSYDLEEVNIRAVNTDKILAEAAGWLKKSNIGGTPLCRYQGKAQYEKIVECRDTTVEYRREYGHYFTSGDVKPRDEWDKGFRSYFVPAYTARSYNLTCAGEDTLTPVFLTSENIRFDVGTRKVFTLIRAIQLFGPLFNGTEQYNIRRIESDDSNYVFKFSTNPGYYPERARISCRGTFIIDAEKHRLKSMTFDYIDYQLFRQAIMSSQRKINSPFSTKAGLTFSYTETGQYYIHSCQQETIWKYDLGDNFLLIEQPSRQFPGTNHLIEKEAIQCYDYTPIPNELQTSRTLVKIHLAQRYPTGKYEPEVFDSLPFLLDNRKAISELNLFMNINKQYQYHNEKTYYPDNYISGFGSWKKSKEVYHANLQAVREQLFDMFPLVPRLREADSSL